MPTAPATPTSYYWPVARPPFIRRGSLSNTYGPTRRNPDGSPRNHQGWDAEAPVGTPILAVADGTVYAVTDDVGDYGRTLTLALSEPTPAGAKYAFYAHLARTDVTVGQSVRAGAVLGASGESGNAKGMAAEDQHLHFEARTEPAPGRGLVGRISPGVAFGWKAPLSRPTSH